MMNLNMQGEQTLLSLQVHVLAHVPLLHLPSSAPENVGFVS